MKITVTAEDIRLGKQFSSSRCPIALAMLRCTRKKQVSIGSLSYRAGAGTGALLGKLPAKARKFVTAFDSDQPVKPFSFLLAVPK